MARRSLKPQLNQIRTWVRQGRTSAWIAHQLEVTVKDIDAFTRDHGLALDDADDPQAGEDYDLRAEDEALIAAELEAEPEADEEAVEEAVEEAGDEDQPKRRRRGRRGGRGRGRRRELEGTFEHGEEGYGLWLDPEVADDPVYAEHWAGHRAVSVLIEPDRIVLRRAGEDADDSEGADAGGE